MEETQMLAILLSEDRSYRARESAANMLLERLSNGFSNRDVLDMLDRMLGGSEKVAMEESLRERLLTIALHVDTLILSNPRQYERRDVRWPTPKARRPDHLSGSWERETGRLRMGKRGG